MPEFWVGVRGDLSASQVSALTDAGLPIAGELRESVAGRGTPAQWETLRTFARVSGEDEAEARARVAAALEIEAGDLVAYSAAVLR